jgi:hypothetical protein
MDSSHLRHLMCQTENGLNDQFTRVASANDVAAARHVILGGGDGEAHGAGELDAVGAVVEIDQLP